MNRLHFAPALLALASLAPAEIHCFESFLEGHQLVPPNFNTGVFISLCITVDDVSGEMHLLGNYNATTGAITEIQLRGPASSATNGPLLLQFPLGGVVGSPTLGTIEASTVLNATQLQHVLDQTTHLHVNTTTFPSGECRGEVTLANYIQGFDLTAAQVVPATGSGSTGSGLVNVNRYLNSLWANGDWSGLQGNVIAVELHGPAEPGSNGSLIATLSHSGNTSGNFFAPNIPISAQQAQWVYERKTYLLITSSAFPGGEIRGQISDFLIGTRFCKPVPNSTGFPGLLNASGSVAVADMNVTLEAWGLPMGQFGFFLTGRGSSQLFPVSGSEGRLCLAGSTIGRYNAQVWNSGSNGMIGPLSVDLAAMPMNPALAVQPGETWNFQAWYRDLSGGQPTSNFTDAVSVTFE